jgi:Ca2+/Na+ antiporter
MKNKLLYCVLLAFIGVILKFVLMDFLEVDNKISQIISIVIIFIFGFFILKGSADIIEETTEILSEKTKIAGGLLQSFGTAFPDMIVGIIASLISLSLIKTNYSLAISYAIIAASATFGSNIYNIAHAIWCVYRQNLSNKLNRNINMFPFTKKFGQLIPISKHQNIPSKKELEVPIDILNALTLLTAFVAILMVSFGKVNSSIFDGDLYQLSRPAGILIFIIAVLIIFNFRKNRREKDTIVAEIEEGEKYFASKPIFLTWVSLILSGLAILFSAEAMVHAVDVFSSITGISTVITGLAAGIIGCLGEMIVIHNYSINPKGRIADALVGIGMDNLITTLGASIVAILGGIFLGGSSLIIIFVLILTLNTVLIWQVGKLERTINFLK